MVLFTTKFFRKLFVSKAGSAYVNKIVQLLMKNKSDDSTELRDDDLRGNSILFTERIGRYDGLSSFYKVPKSGTTIDYWTSTEPDPAGDIVGWWITDHANHKFAAGAGYVRDLSYYDRHARVYGDPCIVSGGAGLILPWRSDTYPSLVTNGNNVCYRIANHSNFQVGTQSFSIVMVVYPKSFAKTNIYSKNCIYLDGSPDGISDYIDFGARTSLWSQSHTKFSFSLWVKFENGGIEDTPGDPDYDQQRTVVGINDSNNNDNIFLFWLDKEKSGLSYDAIACQVTNDGYVTENLRYSSQAAQNNHWYHVVVVYDSTLGSNNLKLYLDGVLQSSAEDVNATGDTIAIDSGTKCYIGKWGDGDTNEFGGNVKDYKWWTNIALTGTEVIDLLNGNTGAVTSPTAEYRMQEGEGTTTRNIQAGVQDANLINGAKWVVSPDFNYSVLEFQKYCTKRDDTDNKYTVWVETDGKLYVSIEEATVSTNKTITSALSLNTWAWIVITYDTSTNTLLIYKDGTEISTATGAHAPDRDNHNLGTAWNDLFFLSNNHKTALADCAVYLLGFMKDDATSSEVTNLFNNKATLTDLTASQVAVINYAIPS